MVSNSNDLFNIKGQVALITGGASGLGQYYTKALAMAGADVFIVSRTDKGWSETNKIVSAFGQKAEFMQQDITEDDAAKKIISSCIDKFGQLDILVNNAGVQIRNKILDFKDSDWLKVININLNALYFLSHEAAKVMAQQHSGKIINIGSMQSFRAGKFIFPYTASKHGVIGLTKAYADALAPEGIQVNAIAPGYIDTAMTKPLQEDKERNHEILAHIPENHWAAPSELMGTVIYLASKASNYVTGSTIAVDGGYLLR
ncbi:glucose 1-dehydrogenase [Oenococcus kitaharae]|uniref:2-deoxy-D-gluconate 3-dehydrogenase n=1 Tax=Oenococcus kitaharae DSM 17330 TaxID=1045004 RepID=G9WHU7_9LACO|nr:glucose 1-dehydrogenase [Oenococcus kitaharae]EHN58671.1 2-deoxy-D-gluconate 3-dehydrogenase [Oenococcus kitaharae DSM 17330]OEY83240.1 2-deoxy-D-gluconate 3-dehydrogenase [Oenococcus kitaharae]OEY84237.1 2-deoxy-D-gluconate 3-dehydrogenase [Oenococcus kitaharae]OEY85856.1 2-deoxy-D-gluconate 3-dehydrogenase [Oenococcus kitaharae]